MPLELIEEHLNGLKLFKAQKFEDERGYFIEAYKSSDLLKHNIKENFLQDNHSKSKRGVLRGMHFQWDKPQGKLIRVISGKIQIAETDIRKHSTTLGNFWTGVLSEYNSLVLWVPPGFANAFLVLEDNTHVVYKCTEEFNPKSESGILWNDPQINIPWQITNPELSQKDANALTLDQWLKREESHYF